MLHWFYQHDAYVLIKSTASNKLERDAIPNLSFGSFKFINQIKSELERRYSRIISYADIVTLATKDSVSICLIIKIKLTIEKCETLVTYYKIKKNLCSFKNHKYGKCLLVKEIAVCS